MAITYPLDMPLTPGIESVSIKAAFSVGVRRSPFTFKSFTHRHAGQAWGASVSLPTMKRAQAEEWEAWLLSLNGPWGTFWLGDPSARVPRGIASGTPITNGANFKGVQVLNTTGWTPSINGILLAGDFIQIGQRLYKVLKNANSNGSGQATLDIFPAIRESIVGSTLILTQNTKGLFSLASSSFNVYESRESKLYQISFDAVEAI